MYLWHTTPPPPPSWHPPIPPASESRDCTLRIAHSFKFSDFLETRQHDGSPAQPTVHAVLSWARCHSSDCHTCAENAGQRDERSGTPVYYVRPLALSSGLVPDSSRFIRGRVPSSYRPMGTCDAPPSHTRTKFPRRTVGRFPARQGREDMGVAPLRGLYIRAYNVDLVVRDDDIMVPLHDYIQPVARHVTSLLLVLGTPAAAAEVRTMFRRPRRGYISKTCLILSSCSLTPSRYR
ncbi:hypothetical protein GY45DRAFT_926568 [Cubamyces sp. BRFM 1775]|nr:hypothetical protein GY45DRAFT_926568 [Cubamyces sp. BRFM 1775]